MMNRRTGASIKVAALATVTVAVTAMTGSSSALAAPAGGPIAPSSLFSIPTASWLFAARSPRIRSLRNFTRATLLIEDSEDCAHGVVRPYEDCAGADLAFVDLTGADLTGVNFSDANRSDADLIYGDLIDADITNAEIDGADFSGARFCGAILPQGGIGAGC